MNPNFSLLSDVDGCAVELMGDGKDRKGFCRYIFDTYSEVLPKAWITKFYIHTSPPLQELHREINIEQAFKDFMAIPDVYQRYAEPMEDAVHAISVLKTRIDVTFITSVEAFPDSYASKHHFLNAHFGDVPVCAIPSKLKYKYMGTWGTDDRYDTCLRWANMGVVPFLFKAPWNEAPHGTPTHGWSGILHEIEAAVDMLEARTEMSKR